MGGESSRFAALNTITSISNVNVTINNYEENSTSNVSSDPLQVCICKSDGLICVNKYYYNTNNVNNIIIQMEVVRGREFAIQTNKVRGLFLQLSGSLWKMVSKTLLLNAYKIRERHAQNYRIVCLLRAIPR